MTSVRLQNTRSIYPNQLYFYVQGSNYQKINLKIDLQ